MPDATPVEGQKVPDANPIEGQKVPDVTPAESQKVLDAIPLLKARKYRMLFTLNTNAFFSKFHQNSQMKFHPLNLVKIARLDLNPHGVIPRQPRSKVKLHAEAEVCNSISKLCVLALSSFSILLDNTTNLRQSGGKLLTPNF